LETLKLLSNLLMC